ncbi:hypothetical protein BDD12DRAFT_894276 [Trichophaea hybrida]|nr:hypothetical protein BDD12DRAFT_894276 [Trichophaea hybrida]
MASSSTANISINKADEPTPDHSTVSEVGKATDPATLHSQDLGLSGPTSMEDEHVCTSCVHDTHEPEHLAEIFHKLHIAESDLAESKSENSSLIDSLFSAKSDIDKLRLLVTEIQDQKSSVEKKLHEAEVANVNLVQDEELAKQLLDRVEVKNGELGEEFVITNMVLHRLRVKCEKLQKENEELRERLERVVDVALGVGEEE